MNEPELAEIKVKAVSNVEYRERCGRPIRSKNFITTCVLRRGHLGRCRIWPGPSRMVQDIRVCGIEKSQKHSQETEYVRFAAVSSYARRLERAVMRERHRGPTAGTILRAASPFIVEIMTDRGIQVMRKGWRKAMQEVAWT